MAFSATPLFLSAPLAIKDQGTPLLPYDSLTNTPFIAPNAQVEVILLFSLVTNVSKNIILLEIPEFIVLLLKVNKRFYFYKGRLLLHSRVPVDLLTMGCKERLLSWSNHQYFHKNFRVCNYDVEDFKTSLIDPQYSETHLGNKRSIQFLIIQLSEVQFC